MDRLPLRGAPRSAMPQVLYATEAPSDNGRIQGLSVMAASCISTAVLVTLMASVSEQPQTKSTAAYAPATLRPITAKPQGLSGRAGPGLSTTRPHVPIVSQTEQDLQAPTTDLSLPTSADSAPLLKQDMQAQTSLVSNQTYYPHGLLVAGLMGLFSTYFFGPKRSVAMASSYAAPAQEEHGDKKGLWKGLGLASLSAVVMGLLNMDWMLLNPAFALCVVFIAGYLGIIFEENLALNKSSIALLMAVGLWTLRNWVVGPVLVHYELAEALGECSEILFFLMGAMTIVEIVDGHQGFKKITTMITTRSKTSMLWIVGAVTFVMSAVLDNLTSTIVMVSLLRKLIPANPELRKLLGGVVVIAANSGGAWTPIGDVTTTMLWINGQITTLPTMLSLVFPSIVSLVVPLALMTFFVKDFKGELALPPANAVEEQPVDKSANLVFYAGVASLIFVPVFKTLTGLPPYMGMLAGLGFMWLLTDILHYGKKDAKHLKTQAALSRIDVEGILFFLGILMAVSCLNAAGILGALASWLSVHLPMKEVLAGAIGLASAVIDNVPLVAATMGMYSLDMIPVNDMFWQLVALCAGTGGSCLIIGSAAGVAFMGMEKVDFGWYAKRISLFALLGYLAGMATYFAIRSVIVFV